jgi:transcription elongation factor GreA
MEKYVMTREGFRNLERELTKLRTKDLHECLINLTEAREKGDLSENAEYEIAKQALEDLNSRMNILSNRLGNSQVIDSVIDDGSVQLLTYVKYENLDTKKIFEFRIVPEFESDLKANKISQNSMIGKSLMNKRVGEIVEVILPREKNRLKILEVRV